MTPYTLDTIVTAQPGETLLAGGTTVIDLMKLGALSPARLVDLSPRRTLASIDEDGDTLRLGALVAAPAARPALAGRVGADRGRDHRRS